MGDHSQVVWWEVVGFGEDPGCGDSMAYKEPSERRWELVRPGEMWQKCGPGVGGRQQAWGSRGREQGEGKIGRGEIDMRDRKREKR